jgi:SAM-dependent methyltransferase
MGQIHERRFAGSPEMLRSPGRIEFLEVERVIDLCLEAFAARSVLDVGTGTGLFAEGFAARGLKVAGIDANPAMAEAARRYVSQAEFRQAPAEAIPYPNGAFDLVFLGLVLHETDNRLQALLEARRVARVGVAVLEWPYREEEHGPPLAHRLRSEEVAVLAQATGFSQVETSPLTHLVFYCLSIDSEEEKKGDDCPKPAARRQPLARIASHTRAAALAPEHNLANRVKFNSAN